MQHKLIVLCIELEGFFVRFEEPDHFFGICLKCFAQSLNFIWWTTRVSNIWTIRWVWSQFDGLKKIWLSAYKIGNNFLITYCSFVRTFIFFAFLFIKIQHQFFIFMIHLKVFLLLTSLVDIFLSIIDMRLSL